jgi:hypothetical protein
MSHTFMILGFLLIILAVSGCVGTPFDLGSVDTRMGGRTFCIGHGYDAFTINGSAYHCVKYGINYTVVENRKVVKLADGTFAFSLSSGGGT